MIPTYNYNTQKQAFHDWVDRTAKDGHFTAGCANHILKKFDQIFAGQQTPAAQSIKDFANWVKVAQKDGHLTQGNVNHISAKVQSLFGNATALSKPLKGGVTKPTKSQTSVTKLLAQAATKSKFLAFYDHTNPLTECFGNFYNAPITYNGLTFKCSEAAFQAAKFINHPGIMKQFCNVDGNGAFKLAKANAKNVRPDWMQNNTNVNVMLDVLREKFKNPKLQQLLLATGDAYLVEHIPVKGRDKFWGDDNDGTGENMLGKLLMQVRGELGGSWLSNKPQEYKTFLQSGKF